MARTQSNDSRAGRGEVADDGPDPGRLDWRTWLSAAKRIAVPIAALVAVMTGVTALVSASADPEYTAETQVILENGDPRAPDDESELADVSASAEARAIGKGLPGWSPEELREAAVIAPEGQGGLRSVSVTSDVGERAESGALGLAKNYVQAWLTADLARLAAAQKQVQTELDGLAKTVQNEEQVEALRQERLELLLIAGLQRNGVKGARPIAASTTRSAPNTGRNSAVAAALASSIGIIVVLIGAAGRIPAGLVERSVGSDPREA